MGILCEGIQALASLPEVLSGNTSRWYLSFDEKRPEIAIAEIHGLFLLVRLR